MIEAAAMWATSVYSWLTPTVLFLLLNLIIATIALTTKSTRPHPSTPGPTTSLLSRSSSLVLDGLKSFTFSSHHHLHTEPPETLPIQKPEPEPEPEPEPHHIDRSQSDMKPIAGEMPEKLPKKMKKSATVKSAFKHFEFGSKDQEEEEVIEIPKRPATTRERGTKREEEGEVDARADDFINRFRNQLKLQRLDSFIRYKDMIKRGAN